MQRTTLKVRMTTEKVLSDSAQELPCALELGCETTSFGLNMGLFRQLCIASPPNRRSQCGETRNNVLYH